MAAVFSVAPYFFLFRFGGLSWIPSAFERTLICELECEVDQIPTVECKQTLDSQISCILIGRKKELGKFLTELVIRITACLSLDFPATIDEAWDPCSTLDSQN